MGPIRAAFQRGIALSCPFQIAALRAALKRAARLSMLVRRHAGGRFRGAAFDVVSSFSVAQISPAPHLPPRKAATAIRHRRAVVKCRFPLS